MAIFDPRLVPGILLSGSSFVNTCPELYRLVKSASRWRSLTITTIAVRDGTIAADSQLTYSGDEAAGSRKHSCKKIFRKKAFGYEVLIATAGEGAPGMLFVDWYGKRGKPPAVLADTEFNCLVLDADGLWEFDQYCRAEKIEEPFYAIGSGAKVALGAMHMGASAQRAVEIAKLVDPYTGGDITTMSLKNGR